MKVQKVPEEFREYIKGYVKHVREDFIQPHFGFDTEGDPVFWKAKGLILNLNSDIEDDGIFKGTALLELNNNTENFRYDWSFGKRIEIIISKETFESDLYKVIYGNSLELSKD